AQIRFLNAERSLRFGELDVGVPELFIGPLLDVAAQRYRCPRSRWPNHPTALAPSTAVSARRRWSHPRQWRLRSVQQRGRYAPAVARSVAPAPRARAAAYSCRCVARAFVILLRCAARSAR